MQRSCGADWSLLQRSRTTGLIPIVRLRSPAGVAAVGAGREPDVSRSVDSASLFRESSSPATALLLDQPTSLRGRSENAGFVPNREPAAAGIGAPALPLPREGS